ncbi:MAG: SDR family NAD(P)-dependent oxidoreductase [Myxococcales bacterium]|nr:SDR family NAD(P)-dependent oxidoreductase [Myxococcales bacterium]
MTEPRHTDLAGKRVLVTGAGGFIGGHVVETLLEIGAEVRALVRYNGRNDWGAIDELSPEQRARLEIVAGDIRDPHQMIRAVEGCDTVLHLAALIAIPFSYVAPQSYVETNITGTLNILEACRLHGTRRVVVTSTSEVYGTARYVPIDEQHPLQGQSPYSASKIGSDKIAESYFLSFDLPVVTLRPFNTYGPRQSDRAVIPTIAAQLAAKTPTLRLGSIDPVRDFLYVKDTARAFVLAATTEGIEGETIHVGTGVGVTIGQLAETMMEACGHIVPIETDQKRIRPAGSEVMRLLCTPAYAKEKMGFEPLTDLNTGLLAVHDYVKARLERYRPGEYMR